MQPVQSHTLLETWVLYRRLGLPRLVHPLLKHCPRAVQARVETLKDRLKVLTRGRLVPEKELTAFYRTTLERLTQSRGSEPLGDYLEFGVYNGSSLVCMYRALSELGLDHVRMFGFDSFEGLPADEEGFWRTGAFKSEYDFTRQVLETEGVPSDRVTLVKGFFSDTLTEALVRQHRLAKASVIMIDCDMYQSTKEALAFCEPLIDREAVLLFDEWHELAERNMGEKRAFDEFLLTQPDIRVEDAGSYSPRAQCFTVTRQPVARSSHPAWKNSSRASNRTESTNPAAENLRISL